MFYFAVMIHPFEIGERKTFSHRVTAADTARFESGEVHAVYSTFALARDAEWSGRLFVLDMKESHEEGIGTSITVRHVSPALIGQEVVFTATLTGVNGNEVVTDYVARVDQRIVAEGQQKQKIINREKLDRLFAGLQ